MSTAKKTAADIAVNSIPPAALMGGVKVLQWFVKMFGGEIPDDIALYLVGGGYVAVRSVIDFIRRRRDGNNTNNRKSSSLRTGN